MDFHILAKRIWLGVEGRGGWDHPLLPRCSSTLGLVGSLASELGRKPARLCVSRGNIWDSSGLRMDVGLTTPLHLVGGTALSGGEEDGRALVMSWGQRMRDHSPIRGPHSTPLHTHTHARTHTLTHTHAHTHTHMHTHAHHIHSHAHTSQEKWIF